MSKFLKKLRSEIGGTSNIIRVSEYHNEVIETDEYMRLSRNQNVYSIAKLFTVTAIGLLYDRGLLNLSDKVCDILSDDIPIQVMDNRWKDVTIEMALKHRIGLPSGFLDIDTTNSSVFGEDYLRYMLTYPLEYTPDTDSKYSDGAYYLLARVAEKICGCSLENYLWKTMLKELNYQEIAWSHCPMGHVIGATGLYIHSEDIVKLGIVYLNKGIYNGKLILSEEWCDLAVNRNYSLAWDETHTMYSKGGMYGQKLFIVPSQNRVVAIQSYGTDTKLIEKFIVNFTE